MLLHLKETYLIWIVYLLVRILGNVADVRLWLLVKENTLTGDFRDSTTREAWTFACEHLLGYGLGHYLSGWSGIAFVLLFFK